MWRRLRELPGRDLVLLIEAWMVLLAVDVGLRLWPVARMRAWAATSRQPAAGGDEATLRTTIDGLHRLVGMASRHHVYHPHCLQRSLALQWLLGRRGVATELRLGVRRDGERLVVHAWLEFQGQPVGEPEAIEERFATLIPISLESDDRENRA